MHALSLASGIAAQAPSFGLPEGQTVSSFFESVNGVQAALLVVLMLGIAWMYVTFIKKDGNVSQGLGYLLILIWLTVFADGLKALQNILLGIAHLLWAYLTGP